MQRFLNWLRGAFQTNTSAGRPRAVRPQLEQLDDRLVPSATTSAITTFGWPGPVHNLFAIDQATGHVIDFTTSSWGSSRRDFGGWASAVSASVDPTTGLPEVFALGGGGSLWRIDYWGNPTYLGGGGAWWNAYTEISATRDGQVYAFKGWPSMEVDLFHADGSRANLGSPDGVWGVSAIAAGRNPYWGGDEVFAMGQDGALYVNSTTGEYAYTWRQIVGPGQGLSALSATQSGSVFAIAQNGNALDQFSESVAGWPYTSWSEHEVGESLGYTSISADTGASGQDEVYATALNWPIMGEDGSVTPAPNLLYHYTQDSSAWNGWSGGVFNSNNDSEVAAADGGYFFEVHPWFNTTVVWAYDPSNAWNPYTLVGTGVE
jgi:hypothetical protein